jgi:hypothetical protein
VKSQAFLNSLRVSAPSVSDMLNSFIYTLLDSVWLRHLVPGLFTRGGKGGHLTTGVCLIVKVPTPLIIFTCPARLKRLTSAKNSFAVNSG